MRCRQSFATILVGKSILLREGIAKILRSANFRIFASVLSVDELVFSNIPPHHQLFLIVYSGDDFDSVIEQIELFRSRYPAARIGIVADRYCLDELTLAFRAGGNGYFVDVTTCQVFVKSIELLMMGETVFPPAFVSSAFGPQSHHADEARQGEIDNPVAEDTIAEQLSPRERSIVQCLSEGDSNKSIARKLDITEATVKVHVKAILRKIRVHNRTQAAIWWMNNGSLPRRLGNETLFLTSANKALPNDLKEMPEIKQIPLSPVNGETNHLPYINGLVLKDSRKSEGLIRLRK
jgi:DNA-binding NarL/FixJ family response regulator